MTASQFIFPLLFLFISATLASNDSQFVAAVYEHVFVAAENKSIVMSKQDTLGIVMRNMDIYESQMQKAKQKVFISCNSSTIELCRQQLQQ